MPEAITTKPQPPGTRRKRRRLVLIVVVIFLALIAFLTVSENPLAQEIRELAGWKHDQPILDSTFSVGAHTFRYYKFSLPQGSANVVVVGHFSCENQTTDNADRDIEAYVLTDTAFTLWQSGQPSTSLYDSGMVPMGTVRVALPAGAGIYYLVFSNKPSLKTAKSVHAHVRLRTMNWLRHMFPRSD